MSAQEITIKTLADFTSVVETTLSATKESHKGDDKVPAKLVNWYRGCGLASYKLQPSLYRHTKYSKVNDLLKLERIMLEWFKRRASVFPNAPADNADGSWNQLFFMQHHHVPTRLLDWTDNPFIALYFALSAWQEEKSRDKTVAKENAAVWVLDPVAWNKVSLTETTWGTHGPLTLMDQEIGGYAPRKSDDSTELKAMQDNACAVYGVVNSARMVAQRGVFTIFGRNLEPMEKQFDSGFPKEALLKIIIPAQEIPGLLDSLFAMGFTDSAAYPDLHGLALEIKRYFDFI